MSRSHLLIQLRHPTPEGVIASLRACVAAACVVFVSCTTLACAESSVDLAPESRLPRWFTLAARTGTKMKNAIARKHSRDENEKELVLADAHWNRGNVRRAFKLFLSLAERGETIAQLNLGYFFDCGIAVRKNKVKALYWYRRAYANGESSGANNIGTIFRDRGQWRRAVEWFERAIKGGNDGSALELAKTYLNAGKHPDRARKYLKMVCASDKVSESDEEEALRLLDELDSTRRS